MEASQSGHVEVVDTLLRHGARVDLQDNVSAEMLYFVIIHHVQLYLKMLTILHDRYIIIILVFIMELTNQIQIHTDVCMTC